MGAEFQASQSVRIVLPGDSQPACRASRPAPQRPRVARPAAAAEATSTQHAPKAGLRMCRNTSCPASGMGLRVATTHCKGGRQTKSGAAWIRNACARRRLGHTGCGMAGSHWESQLCFAGHQRLLGMTGPLCKLVAVNLPTCVSTSTSSYWPTGRLPPGRTPAESTGRHTAQASGQQVCGWDMQATQKSVSAGILQPPATAKPVQH